NSLRIKSLDHGRRRFCNGGVRLGMSPSIRRMIWGTLLGLALLTASSVGLTIAVLRMVQRLGCRLVQETRPLLDAVRAMDEALSTMVSASRGYLQTGQTAFSAQYDQAV